MEITPISDFDKRPWRILGIGEGAKISVAPSSSVKVDAAGFTAIIPLPIVVALQTNEAINFIKSPMVAPFFYAANERESRIRAARDLASLGISKKRRALVEHLTKDHGLDEKEAWVLASANYPLNI